MKVLTSLAYYSPYISGVTIYAQRLSQALAKKGHQVVVLTSRYDSHLAALEEKKGVLIERVPIWCRLSKGFLMPRWLKRAWIRTGQAEVVLIHLPQPAGLLLAMMTKLRGKNIYGVYHCEVVLPSGFLNRFIQAIVWATTFLTCGLLTGVVAYTKDYATSSPILKHFLRKVVYILPPVEVQEPVLADQKRIRGQVNRQKDELIVGFAGRVAAEKGIEVLIKALEKVENNGQKTKLVIAGPIEGVVGEKNYQAKIIEMMEKKVGKIIWLGPLSQAQIGAFYQEIDLLALPSLNRTESFGLVQIEAMLFGKPVVASDLPGVRVPVQMTGMGALVPIGETEKLAAAISRVGQQKNWPRKETFQLFDAQSTYARFERLLQSSL